MNKDPALKCSVLVYHPPHTPKRKSLCFNSLYYILKLFKISPIFFVILFRKIFIFFWFE